MIQPAVASDDAKSKYFTEELGHASQTFEATADNTCICQSTSVFFFFSLLLPDRSWFVLNVMDAYQCLMGNRGLTKRRMEHTHQPDSMNSTLKICPSPPTYTHTHSAAVLPFLIPFISLCSLSPASKSRVRGVIC